MPPPDDANPCLQTASAPAPSTKPRSVTDLTADRCSTSLHQAGHQDPVRLHLKIQEADADKIGVASEG
jgi:hypothetical protein